MGSGRAEACVQRDGDMANPGATGWPTDPSVQESISGRLGVPAAISSFGCRVTDDEHPAARLTAMASTTSRIAALLCTVPIVNPSNTDRPELRRTQRLPGVQKKVLIAAIHAAAQPARGKRGRPASSGRTRRSGTRSTRSTVITSPSITSPSVMQWSARLQARVGPHRSGR
jgi:hypothetical protein